VNLEAEPAPRDYIDDLATTLRRWDVGLGVWSRIRADAPS